MTGSGSHVRFYQRILNSLNYFLLAVVAEFAPDNPPNDAHGSSGIPPGRPREKAGSGGLGSLKFTNGWPENGSTGGAAASSAP
jgi:hypothetical protein